MVLLIVLLPILTACNQEIIPGPGPSNSRESDSSDEGTVTMTVRATLPSALNVINASSVGKLVQLVTASRLTLYHEGRIDPMKDECYYQVKH